MALLKKLWELSRFHKGLSNVNADGSFWWSQGLDFRTSAPAARVSRKLFKETDETSIAIAENVWGVAFRGFNFTINKVDGKIFADYGGSWNFRHENTSAYGGLGLYSDDDYLYFASNGYAGRADAATETYTDTWQAFNVSNNGKLCPINKFLKFICFGNGRYLAVWDIGASAWNNTRITLPANYTIKWLAPLSDYLVISAHHEVYGSILFLWDGSSQTYNSAVRLPGVTSLAGVIDNNSLYVVTDDGHISRFTGADLDPKVRFPDMEEGDKIDVNPGAVISHNGAILIGKKAEAYNLNKRYYAGGVWEFDPATNALVFKHLMSTFGIVQDSGPTIFYSLFTTPDHSAFRAGWYDGFKVKIDKSNSAGAPQPYNYGTFLVTPTFDNAPALRKRFIQQILNFWKPLPNEANARYVLKYNITEKYSRGTIGATSGGANYFIASVILSGMEVGDEVTVLAGNGAAQIRHITAIDTATKQVTVDENLSGGAVFASNSVIMVSPFKKIGVIKGSDYPNIVNKLLRFNARAKKIQFKIEIWSPTGTANQWDMGLDNITTVYIPDRTVR